jgi:nucleotide-binding universal stress UspA family protein
MPPVDRERLQAEVVVRVGRRPSTEILTYAAEQNIDLIVLGKNGSPEGSAEAGSVVEAVVRGSRCPVLVVPAGTALSHRGRA